MKDKFKRARLEAIFSRRSKLAIKGLHLPSTVELLHSMPFREEHLMTDAQEFIHRLYKRWPELPDEEAELHQCLKAVQHEPGAESFRRAAQAFRAIKTDRNRIAREYDALRFDYYAASMRCPESARRVAVNIVYLALSDKKLHHGFLLLIEQALGWSYLAAKLDQAELDDISTALSSNEIRDRIEHEGSQLINLLVSEWKERETARRRVFAWPDGNDKSEKDKSEPGEPGLVVIKEIGNPDTSEGKTVQRTYRRLKSAKLPLIPRPDLQDVREQLLAEFPHAQQIIDTMLNDLTMRTEVYIRPTIFIGTPGTGKTRFAQQFLSALKVPNETFSCGGVSDGAIAGTPRRWSTGEPSLPINLVRRFNCASPGIIMDELEKAGSSRHNGNLVDALLGMFEPQSARNWHDPYLEANVDISQVIWLATVNSLDTLSAPFRDRCRIITFPEPGPEHLYKIGNSLLVQAYEELGMDKRWALPLTGKELDILGSYWKGGSVRHLRRLIDAVVATREKMTNQH
ncbi:AAA family ATPase [Fodinicurvata halophila]|uniref:AAA family ATPase n=1 Tax=Fodinicurvata halophila TaxID=1419723 RepID=A0ABV8ULZ8_9PROT